MALDRRLTALKEVTQGLELYALMKPHELWKKATLIDALMDKAGAYPDLAEKVFETGKHLIVDVIQRSGNTPRAIGALSKNPAFSRRVFDIAMDAVDNKSAAPEKKAYLLASLGKTLPHAQEHLEKFVEAGIRHIKPAAAADVEISAVLIDTLMEATRNAPKLMFRVICETLDILPMLDPDGLRETVYGILQGSGEALDGDRVYHEFAISRDSPTSKWPTIVYDDAETNEPRVSIGCFTGLTAEFKAAVQGKHAPGTEARAHYDQIAEAIESNAVARARELAPSIADIFNDRKLRRLPESEIATPAPFPVIPPRQTALSH